MRLLSEESQKLVYGGLSGWVMVGLGLIVAGLAFGVVPLVCFLDGRGVPFLILAAVGLVLLLAGIWGIGHRHRIEFDGRAGVIRVMQGNRFLSGPDSLPFDRVTEVGIIKKIYTSVSAGVARQFHVVELRLTDGGSIEIHDQDVEQDLEQTRQRGRRIAELVGAPFDGEASPPA